MPYAPGITYDYRPLFQGIAGAGQSIGNAIQQIGQDQSLDAYNQMIADKALQSGQITRDEHNKFMGMGRKQRTGFAAGLMSNYVQSIGNNWQTRMAAANVNAAMARAQYERSMADYATRGGGFGGTGYQAQQVAPGVFAIPGKGGQPVIFHTGKQPENRRVFQDPQRGWISRDMSSGAERPATIDEINVQQMYGPQQGQQQPAREGFFPSLWHRLFGGQPAVPPQAQQIRDIGPYAPQTADTQSQDIDDQIGAGLKAAGYPDTPANRAAYKQQMGLG